MSSSKLLLKGAVAEFEGRAILVLGPEAPGPGELVSELVALGAEKHNCDPVALDSEGRFEGLQVGLIVSAERGEDAEWSPNHLRGAGAVLLLLENVANEEVPLAGRLQTASRLVARVPVLRGCYSDATAAAQAIIAQLRNTAHMEEASSPQLPSPKPEDGQASSPVSNILALDAHTGEEPFLTPEERDRLSERHFVLLLGWHGRFGNRMHQYAYGATYADIHGCQFWLPSDWEGSHLFAKPRHVLLPGSSLRAAVNGIGKDDPDQKEARLKTVGRIFSGLKRISPADPEDHYPAPDSPVCFDDLCAYNPGIFARMSRNRLLDVFEWSKAVKSLDIYKRLEDRQGSYDIAHLRRGDISNPKYNKSHVQGYSVVSKGSYMRAFKEHGFDPDRIEWVSDDRTGKWHAQKPASPPGGWRYPQGSRLVEGVIFDWLEDFLRLYFARTVFRANSSFSWWAAFLSPHARVFSPVLDRRHVYGVDGLEEIDVSFVEGNHPHWMYGCSDIQIPD